MLPAVSAALHKPPTGLGYLAVSPSSGVQPRPGWTWLPSGAFSGLPVSSGANAFAFPANSQAWKAAMPRITPFYAVKCNPEPGVLKLLNAMGTGFDCASKGELEMMLKVGVWGTEVGMPQDPDPDGGLWLLRACAGGRG